MGFLCNKQKTVSISSATKRARGQAVRGGTGDRKQNNFPKHKSNADRQQQGDKSTLSTAAFHDKQHNTAIKERKRRLFSSYKMEGQINV